MSWDWSRLLARSSEGRQAIYDERFLGRWEQLLSDVGGVGAVDFNEHEAMQLLTVFATKWEALSYVPRDLDFRYHLVVFDLAGTSEQVAVRFAGRMLRNDQIVVSHPAIVRRF